MRALPEQPREILMTLASTSNLEHSEKVGKPDMAHEKDMAEYLQQFTWAGYAGGQSDPLSS